MRKRINTKSTDFSIENVTRSELAKALLQLGFDNHSDAKRFFFTHPNIKAKVSLVQGEQRRALGNASFAATAVMLADKGILKSNKDLADLIAKNRAA